MARKQKPEAAGFTAPPADGGLSIDRLAQAFAAMMGSPEPEVAEPAPAAVVEVDASPDLDAEPEAMGCRSVPGRFWRRCSLLGFPAALRCRTRRSPV